MSAKTQEFRVCRIQDLDDPGSLEAELASAGENSAIFVVRVRGLISAYVNRCPHTGAPLNWLPDQFLDYAGELIQCATHGALFHPLDGECVRGPCLGQFLQPLRVEVRQGVVYVKHADP